MHYLNSYSYRTIDLLIEPEWNVNFLLNRLEDIISLLLIEPEWNVNVKD